MKPIAIPQVVATSALAVIVLQSASSQADPKLSETTTGKAYELSDESRSKPLFTFEKRTDLDGSGETSTSSYKSTDGQDLVTESTDAVISGASRKLKSYKISLKQIDAEGLVTVENGKAQFKYTKSGKTQSASEKADESFIVGPLIVPFIQAHWPEIMKGDHVKARLAVPDRAETVGFEYFKEKEGPAPATADKAASVCVKMKPSSFIISALVDPLRFYFAPDGKRLIEIEGRTQPKRKAGSGYKDQDVRIIYDRPSTP